MTTSFTVKGLSCLVDDIDADLVSITWTPIKNKSGTYYLNRCYQGKATLIHRVILERAIGITLTRNDRVDHINGNGLDNTRSNLRLATHSQNLHNSGVQKTNKLGVKGVSMSRGLYMAQIIVNKKHYFLGRFKQLEDAKQAYIEAAKEHYGEFARW